MAIVGHFELLWSEMIQKVANLGKLANVLPPLWKQIFLNFAKIELLWCEMVGKLANQVKLAHPSQSETLFGEKDGKIAN